MDDCTDIRIRRARPDDARALASLSERLFRETYRGEVAATDLDAFIAESFGEAMQAEELADPETITLMVERDGEAVGYVQIRRRRSPALSPRQPATPAGGGRPDDTAAEAELTRLYLDRGCHGRGVAKPVLREAARRAQELGAQGMWLGVWERNGRAISFYRKSGFRPVGAQEFRVGSELHRDLVMAADLATVLR